MKQWIKLETSLLTDPRITHLLDELGLKGLGLYTVLRLSVESGMLSDKKELVLLGGRVSSRRYAQMVLEDFELFNLTDPHNVSLAYVHAHADTHARECVRECAREHVRGGVRADEPISSNLENKENREYSSLGSSGGVAEEVAEGAAGKGLEKGTAAAVEEGSDALLDPLFAPYHQERWFGYIADLLDNSNRPWRETLLMHCGYGALLQQYWTDGVLFFIQHVIIQSQEYQLIDIRSTRQYFANFSRLGTPSGKRLMEHLQHIDQQVRLVHPSNTPPPSQPLPAGAPPRPSATAVWNYATDEWMEPR